MTTGGTGQGAPRRVVLGAVLAALVTAPAGCGLVRRFADPEPDGIRFPEGPLGTAELLPYGRRYRTEEGLEVTVERVAGPALAATGDVAFADPGFIRYEDVEVAARFEHTVPCELAMVTFPATTVDGHAIPEHRRGATVAFGDVSRVQVWDDARTPAGEPLGFSADAGTGCLYDVAAKPALDRLDETRWGPLFEEVIAVGFAAVDLDGGTAAVMFDCGVGDGWYPAYLGHDDSGDVVAVAADLELHHHLTPVDG